MTSPEEAMNAIPLNFDMNRLTDTLEDQTQVLHMLNKDRDGRVTEEDFKILLEQFDIKDENADILSKFVFNELGANANGSLDTNDLANAGNIIWHLFEKKKNNSAR
jgi:hypothetical protein